MKNVLLILAFVSIVGVAHAGVLTSTKDASTFSHFFAGTDMHDGTSFQNGWLEFGSNSANTTVTDIGGGMINIAANTPTSDTIIFGGSDSTNGSSTWNDGIAGTTVNPPSAGNTADYTLEIKIRLNDVTNGFRIWSGMGDGRDWFDIYNDGVGITKPGGGFLAVPMVLNDGEFHTFRVVNDGNVSGDIYKTTHFFIDGVALSDTDGNPWTSSSNDSRLLFGDFTGGDFADGINYDIEYYAYDQSGAYAPIPEPVTMVLLGLGGLLIRKRR